MTVNELKKVVDEAVKNGHGETRVHFDTEARCFHFHLIEIDRANYELLPIETEKGEAYFILSTSYHLADGITDAV